MEYKNSLKIYAIGEDVRIQFFRRLAHAMTATKPHCEALLIVVVVYQELGVRIRIGHYRLK